MSSKWWPADPTPSPRLRGEGGVRGLRSQAPVETESPLTPTLSPEYGGEGV